MPIYKIFATRTDTYEAIFKVAGTDPADAMANAEKIFKAEGWDGLSDGEDGDYVDCETNIHSVLCDACGVNFVPGDTQCNCEGRKTIA